MKTILQLKKLLIISLLFLVGNVCLGQSICFTSNSIVSNPLSTPATANILVNQGVSIVPLSTGNLDDGGWNNIPIGFDFNFFGTTYNSINVSTNGTLIFGTLGGLNDFTFTTLPSTSEPRNMIAILAMDHDLSTDGKISYWYEGSYPNRKFIVSYEGVEEFPNASEFSTFQAVLYETTGIIDVNIISSTNIDRNKVVGLNDPTGLIGNLAYASGTIANSSNPITNPFSFRFVPFCMNAPIATEATNVKFTSFTANWNVVPTATNYILEIATDIDFTTIISTINTNDNSYTINNLTDDTVYYYRVRANNIGANSANSNTITTTTLKPGITIITHGFQATGGGVGSLFSPTEDFEKMGAEIIKRAGGGIMYINNTHNGQLEIVPNSGNNDYPFDATKEIVLVYNWGNLSNNEVISQTYVGNGYLESAADNLFASILKLRNPLGTQTLSLEQFLQKPKHIIGHSRGTIVNLQMLHRFLNYFPNTTIEQVTTLDPHPATVFGDMKRFIASNPTNTVENLPGIFGIATDCGFPGCLLDSDISIIYPENVIKADNYYRRDSEYEGTGSLGAFDGIKVDGINNFNRELNNEVLYIGSPSILSVPNAHSGVHKWYLGTINTNIVVAEGVNASSTAEQNTNNWYTIGSTSLPNNFLQNESRTSTGYTYSRIGGRYNQLSAIDPGQKRDINQLNAQLGQRYGTPNEVAPKNIFNGDFHYNNEAGWTKNGGNFNPFSASFSSGEAIIINNLASLRHSLMYFGNSSNDYKFLVFKVKKNNGVFNGNLIINFFGTNISNTPTIAETIEKITIPIQANITDQWKTIYVPIPSALRPSVNSPNGEVGTFSVEIDTPTISLSFDDFDLTSCIPISDNLFVTMPDPQTLLYTDVQNDDWFKEGVYKSRNYGLFRGTSFTTFSPDTNLTKAQAVTVLVRAGIKLGVISTYNTTGLPYADVTSCNQYFPYIQTAKNLGHLEFTSNFSPNDPITVAELCVYMDKILKINLHDWNASSDPWVMSPLNVYVTTQMSQINITQTDPVKQNAMRRILNCIDVVKNDNVIESYRTQNVWTLKDVENIPASNGLPINVDGTATVTRARMAVAVANMYRFLFKKLNIDNGNPPAGRMANGTNTTTADPSIDDFIGIGNTFDNKDVPATDTPEAPSQIEFNINSGDTLGLQYQSDTDTAGNPQFFYWSMNKNVDGNMANLVSVPINSIQNHRKVNFVAPVVTSPKTWYLYSYLANNKGKIKETVITINVSSTLSTDEVDGILDNVKIYPNPTDNILFIDTIDNQIQKIEIFDLQGRLLKTIKENKEKYQIDISTFSSATYLFKLSTEKGNQTVKIVKQ